MLCAFFGTLLNVKMKPMKLKKLIRLKTHFKYFAMKAGRVILYQGL